jgi:hypothetical protein
MASIIGQTPGAPYIFGESIFWLYPTISQNDVTLSAGSAGYSADEQLVALLSLRANFADRGDPVTPSMAARALRTTSTELEEDLSTAQLGRTLLVIFAKFGVTLDATEFGTALRAADPPLGDDANELAPIIEAFLAGQFTMSQAAIGMSATPPRFRASALAGALKRVYLGATAEPREYARSLAGRGFSPMEVARLLAGAYVWPRLDELALVLLYAFDWLRADSLTLARSVRSAGGTIIVAAPAIRAVVNEIPAIGLARAIKAAFPDAALLAAARRMVEEFAPPDQVAAAVRLLAPDLTATLNALILEEAFAPIILDLSVLAAALQTAAYNLDDTAIAVRSLNHGIPARTVAILLKALLSSGLLGKPSIIAL